MNLLKQLSSDLETLVARTSPAVVGIEHRRGQGTGWVLAQDGYILTNCHVVQDARSVRVCFPSEHEVTGEIVGMDHLTDLAVVRSEMTGLPALPLANPSGVRVGQLVVAIGNPFQFERSISLGVVSALDRSLPTPGGGMIEGLIQTDAAINPGNSGGPLVNVDGQVVGVNTAVIPYAQGMGFAIPSATASWVAAVLISRGAVNRPYLGIAARGQELEAKASKEAGQPRGVRILGVGDNTPAEAAGLRRGDLLLKVNGDSVGNVDDLQRIMVLSERRDVSVQVVRNAKRREFVITPSRQAA